MVDVFISYKSERRPGAQHLAKFLEAHGLTVWFDYGLLPGQNFGRQIEDKMREATLAIVLWCDLSVQSDWVREEAQFAKKRGIFMPIRIAETAPPLGFGMDQYIDLVGWDGDPLAREVDRLVEHLEQRMGRELPIGRGALRRLHDDWERDGRPCLVSFDATSVVTVPDAERKLPSLQSKPLDAADEAGGPATGSGHIEAPQTTSRRGSLFNRLTGRTVTGSRGDLWVDQSGGVKIDARRVHGPSEAAQAGWLKPGNGKEEWFQDHPLAPQMVVVPPGEFLMGSPPDEEGRMDDGREGPQHLVTIAEPFAVGRYAVTVGEFTAFVEATGYEMPDKMHTFEDDEWKEREGGSFRNPGFTQSARHPVVGVSWEDAEAYSQWLTETTGQQYRLPSEAEWECVCRTTKDTPFWWGASISKEQANYDGNFTYGGGAKGEYRQRTMPVDSFEPNPWGLYQVHGNVFEWCADCWHENYRGAPDDGSVWQSGATSLRVVRGGSWYDNPRDLRSASRYGGGPGVRSIGLGFRVSRTLTP